MIEYIKNILMELDSCPIKEYGALWVKHRIKFWEKYQKSEKTFSTIFGISFFEEILYHLENKNLKEINKIPDENIKSFLKKHI